MVQPTNAAIRYNPQLDGPYLLPGRSGPRQQPGHGKYGVGLFSIKVTVPGDSDPTTPPAEGTLRWAIDLANAHPNVNGVPDVITIDLPARRVGPHYPRPAVQIDESVIISAIEPSRRVEVDAACLDTALIINGAGSRSVA